MMFSFFPAMVLSLFSAIITGKKGTGYFFIHKLTRMKHFSKLNKIFMAR
jgi:hypothetical protein